MQGKKVFEDEKILIFSLSAHVPEHNFYRRLKQRLDLDFLYELTQPYYGWCGQETLFELLFNKIFSLCVENAMVTGHTQAIDSAPIKANASMDSLVLKQPAESFKTHLMKVNAANAAVIEKSTQNKRSKPEQFLTVPEHQLRRLEKHQATLISSPGSLGAKHEKARLVSNKKHYSPTDPDARISVKPGKTRKLNYHCSMAVDTAEGVISHVQADFADGRDSQYLPAITLRLQRRLEDNELHLQELLADGAYCNGSNYAFLEQRQITGWIPVFGQYKPELADFPYNREADHFTCPTGKVLSFKTYDTSAEGSLLKIYRANYQDCQHCSLKPTCVPKSQCRQITRTAYDQEYRRALARQQSKKGKHMKRLRRSTVEPVFGSLIEHYGIREIAVRGKAGANKVMLMAATAFNLKKYMKFKPMEVVSQAIALKNEPEGYLADNIAGS